MLIQDVVVLVLMVRKDHTFHHHLAGGGPVFARQTGIVHVSGVIDPVLASSQMSDADRVLVDAADRLGNITQIQALPFIYLNSYP